MKTPRAGIALAILLAVEALAGIALWKASAALHARVDAFDARLAALERQAAKPMPAAPAAPATSQGSSAAIQLSLAAEVRRLSARVEALARVPAPSEEERLEAQDRERLEDPRNRAAHDDALAIVDSAVEAGEWSSRAAGELREKLPLLTREQRDEVIAVLIGALNGGIAVDSFPPY